MAGRTTFPLIPQPKRLHVLSMAHDQSDVFQWRGQIPRRDFRHAQNMLVTTEADVGVHLGSKIVRLGRRAEQIDREVLRPAQALSWIQPSTPGLTWQTTHVTSLCEDLTQLSCEGVIVWQLAQSFG